MATSARRASTVTAGKSQVSVLLHHRNSLQDPASTHRSLNHPPASMSPLRKENRNNGPRMESFLSMQYPNTDDRDPIDRYPHWMTKFCGCPSGECETTALAIFLPCVLYGKTEWRIKRFSRGEDGNDSSWTAKYGCNGPCWMWAMIRVCLPIFSFLPIMVQRTTVRGMYGISGSTGKDCIVSFFCEQCIMAQLDREVRGREGDINLRDNPQYKEYSMALETQQPGLNLPMSYLASHSVHDSIPGNSQRQTIETICIGDSTVRGYDSNAGANPESSIGRAKGKENAKELPKPTKKSNEELQPKLSSAYMSEDDENCVEVGTTKVELLSLPQPSDNMQCNVSPGTTEGTISGVSTASRGSIHNFEIASLTSPVRQEALGDYASGKGGSLPSDSSPQQRPEECFQIAFAEVTGPQRLFSLITETIIDQDQSSNNEAPQHKSVHCGSAESTSLVQQQPPSVCASSSTTVSQRRVSIIQHNLSDCANAGVEGSQKSPTLSVCGEMNQGTGVYKSTTQHSLPNCTGENSPLATEHRTFVVCENANQAISHTLDTSNADDLDEFESKSPGSDKKTMQHNMTDYFGSSTITSTERHTLSVREDSSRVLQATVTKVHGVAECDSRGSYSTVAQQKLAQCLTNSGVTTPVKQALSVYQDVGSPGHGQYPTNDHISTDYKLAQSLLEQYDSVNESEHGLRSPLAQHALSECLKAAPYTRAASTGKLNLRINNTLSNRSSFIGSLDRRLASGAAGSTTSSVYSGRFDSFHVPENATKISGNETSPGQQSQIKRKEGSSEAATSSNGQESDPHVPTNKPSNKNNDLEQQEPKDYKGKASATLLVDGDQETGKLAHESLARHLSPAKRGKTIGNSRGAKVHPH